MFVVTYCRANAEIREQGEMRKLLDEFEKHGRVGVLNRISTELSSATRSTNGDVRVEEILLASDRYSFFLPYMRRGFDEDRAIVGDVFFTDDNVIMIQPRGKRLAIYEVRHHSVSSQLEDIASQVAESAANSLDKRRLRGMSFDWEFMNAHVVRPRRRIVGDEAADGSELVTRKPEFSEAEYKQSLLLVTNEHRQFLQKLAQALGKARSADTLGEGSGVVPELLSAGLVRNEYLVTCKHDHRTICTVNDPSTLRSVHADSARCATCNRPLYDENVQEIHALTTEARSLLNSSHWMMIWVTQVLENNGIAKEAVQWNAVAGGDELDIMLEIMGMRVFFELKDRDFGLGDAYAFATRVARYEGDHGVVITLGSVAGEAKSFFNENRSGSMNEPPITSIEGPTQVNEKLPAILDQISREATKRILVTLFEVGGPVLHRLVETWMNAWLERNSKHCKLDTQNVVT
jgi:hypothetical protein